MTETCEFTDFVRAQTGVLLRTAYLLTGSASAAEELVQDTLVRLYPKWHRVEVADYPLAYVRRALTNGFINQRRRRASTEILVDEPPERSDSSDPPGRYDDRDELWRRLLQLSERQRAALVLRYFEDLPDEQIAAALDARPGTVRSLISRGLVALREQDGAAGGWTAPERPAEETS
jgi:RNA polymerase sigma-70 factor (sigma-E family)